MLIEIDVDRPAAFWPPAWIARLPLLELARFGRAFITCRFAIFGLVSHQHPPAALKLVLASPMLSNLTSSKPLGGRRVLHNRRRRDEHQTSSIITWREQSRTASRPREVI